MFLLLYILFYSEAFMGFPPCLGFPRKSLCTVYFRIFFSVDSIMFVLSIYGSIHNKMVLERKVQGWKEV